MRWPVLIAFILLALSGYGRSMPMLIQQSATGATLVGADLNDPNVVPPPTGITCTTGIGPFTSATTMTTISNTINALDPAGGQIVCLQRGQTWSGSSGLSLTDNYPNGNRVTICASTGTGCTDSGAANPRITITSSAQAVNFAADSGGYTIKNLDLYNTNTSNTSLGAVSLGDRSKNITLEGMLEDGFYEAFSFPDQVDTNLPDNIRIGTCGGAGHWFEVRNGPTTFPGGDRQLEFGGIKNSFLSVYIHDYVTPGGGAQQTSHWWDIGGQGTATTASHNVTLECGLYALDPAQPNAVSSTANKFFRVTGLVIRDNIFTCVPSTAFCSVTMIGFGDHASGNEGVTGSGVACAGAAVYRNTFINTAGVKNQIGEDVCVYNNVMYTNGGAGIYQNHYAGASQVNQTLIANTWVFDNTIYVIGNVVNTFQYLWGNDQPVDRPRCSNCKVFNNLVWIADTGGAGNAYNVVGGTCAEFGTNGVNLKNNFVYSPNHTPGVLWDTCSADTGNSTTFNTNPLLVNAPAFNFHPTTSGSPPCNFGITSGTYPQPTDDFDLVTRGTPPDVGAYECP